MIERFTGPGGAGSRMAAVILVVLGILFAIPWTVTAQNAAASKSILKNGGMEIGKDSPSDWKQGADVSGVEYRWDKAAAHSGKASLCLVKTAARYFPIAQWSQTVMAASSATKLKVSAWVKAEGVRKATIDVQFSLPDGKSSHEWAAYIGQKKPTDPPATHGWKRYEGVVKIPEDAGEITVALQIYGPGKVWFDDVTAEFVPQPAEPGGGKSDVAPAPAVVSTSAPSAASLASNPGFEDGNGDAPSGWQQGAVIDGVEYLWDRRTGHGGKASLSIRKTSNRFFPVAQWFQPIAVEGSYRRLRVSAWVKASRVPKAVLDVQFSPDGDAWTHAWASYIGAKEQGDPPADHGWRKYEGTVDIPPGTKNLLIGLQMYGPGQVWFDDLAIEYVD